MGVGADQRVGIGPGGALGVLAEDHATEMLDVHLVHDTGVRWYDLEVLERGLAPAQERIALAITLKLDFRIASERVGAAVGIDLD